jgi:two-component system response regulator
MNDRQIVLTRQIVLIEDNPDDRELTIRALRKHNILNPVTVASDGAEALTVLLGDDHRDLGNPALILLDLYLPKINGLEVLRRIRADQRTRAVPVLILTPGGKDEDLCAAYDLGANGSIRQPIAFSQFSEAVHAVGLFWLLHPPGRLSVRKAAPRARRQAGRHGSLSKGTPSLHQACAILASYSMLTSSPRPRGSPQYAQFKAARVMLKPDRTDDIQAQVIVHDIAKQAEEEPAYPGQIRITVVRESRSTEFARGIRPEKYLKTLLSERAMVLALNHLRAAPAEVQTRRGSTFQRYFLSR